MLKNKIKNMPINPTFILFFLWFLTIGKITDFFVFFVVLAIHEYGHYIIAKRCGYSLNSFSLSPYGMALSFKNSNFSNKEECLIALAGPSFNFISVVFVVCFWWIYPPLFSFTNAFVYQSLCLAIFNLLPAYPLDGGRILVSLISLKNPRKKALKIAIINNIIFSIIFAVLLIISCFFSYNPFLILPIIFLMIGILDINKEIKYQSIYKLKKTEKNFDNIRILYVKSDTKISQALKKIEKNNSTLFYVNFENKTKIISEKQLINLTLICDINQTFDNVFASQRILK